MLSPRRHKNYHQLWRMLSGRQQGNAVWETAWKCCLGHVMGMLSGRRHGNAVWEMAWECCLGDGMGMLSGRQHGNVVWETAWECCLGDSMGMLSGILNLPPSLIVICPHLNQLEGSVGGFTTLFEHTTHTVKYFYCRGYLKFAAL